jgi:hypothetical protein
MQIGNGRIQISRGVVQVFQSTEALQERLFGREMQNLQRSREEICLLLQVKPQQTVAFQGQTLGAHPIVHRLTIAIRQELAEVLPADWTFHLVAPIKRADQKTEQVTAPDQELTGKYLGEQRDEFFHYDDF